MSHIGAELFCSAIETPFHIFVGRVTRQKSLHSHWVIWAVQQTAAGTLIVAPNNPLPHATIQGSTSTYKTPELSAKYTRGCYIPVSGQLFNTLVPEITAIGPTLIDTYARDAIESLLARHHLSGDLVNWLKGPDLLEGLSNWHHIQVSQNAELQYVITTPIVHSVHDSPIKIFERAGSYPQRRDHAAVHRFLLKHWVSTIFDEVLRLQDRIIQTRVNVHCPILLGHYSDLQNQLDHTLRAIFEFSEIEKNIPLPPKTQRHRTDRLVAEGLSEGDAYRRAMNASRLAERQAAIHHARLENAGIKVINEINKGLTGLRAYYENPVSTTDSTTQFLQITQYLYDTVLYGIEVMQSWLLPEGWHFHLGHSSVSTYQAMSARYEQLGKLYDQICHIKTLESNQSDYRSVLKQLRAPF